MWKIHAEKVMKKIFLRRSTSKDLTMDVHSYESLVESFSSALQLLPCLIVIDSINDFRIAMDQDIGSIKSKLAIWISNYFSRSSYPVFDSQ